MVFYGKVPVVRSVLERNFYRLFAFPIQRGLVDPQLARNQNTICRNPFSCLQQHEVAHYDLGHQNREHPFPALDPALDFSGILL